MGWFTRRGGIRWKISKESFFEGEGMRNITENFTYTFVFLLKRNDRHVKADYRIDLSISRYERVIDYVLS